MWRRILFIGFIFFCVVLGILLVVLPWSELWERERNFLLALFPDAGPLLLNSYFRGAVSGLGLVNLWVGLSDAWNFRRLIMAMEQVEKPPEPGALP